MKKWLTNNIIDQGAKLNRQIIYGLHLCWDFVTNNTDVAPKAIHGLDDICVGIEFV